MFDFEHEKRTQKLAVLYLDENLIYVDDQRFNSAAI